MENTNVLNYFSSISSCGYSVNSNEPVFKGNSYFNKAILCHKLFMFDIYIYIGFPMVLGWILFSSTIVFSIPEPWQGNRKNTLRVR